MYGYETGLFKRTKGISGSGSYLTQTSSSELIGNGTSIFIGHELQFAGIPEDILHHYVYRTGPCLGHVRLSLMVPKV